MEWTEEELVVTSLRRPFDPEVKTRHATQTASCMMVDPRRRFTDEPFVTAVDIRRDALDAVRLPRLRAPAFCRHVQHCYGNQIGVVLEPEWLSPARRKKMTAPHIHFQLKKPIRWTTLV